MKENNIFEEENLNDFDDIDPLDEDFFDCDCLDEEENESHCIKAVKMKRIVSYFEINGISGMMAFSDKTQLSK